MCSTCQFKRDNWLIKFLTVQSVYKLVGINCYYSGWHDNYLFVRNVLVTMSRINKKVRPDAALDACIRPNKVLKLSKFYFGYFSPTTKSYMLFLLLAKTIQLHVYSSTVTVNNTSAVSLIITQCKFFDAVDLCFLTARYY